MLKPRPSRRPPGPPAACVFSGRLACMVVAAPREDKDVRQADLSSPGAPSTTGRVRDGLTGFPVAGTRAL